MRLGAPGSFPPMSRDDDVPPPSRPGPAALQPEDAGGAPPDPTDIPRRADEDDEPPHLHRGSPHDDEPAPYDPPNPNVP